MKKDLLIIFSLGILLGVIIAAELAVLILQLVA